ncbi:RES family NAD+ phosphorylase [Cronobacter malonaticus]|uniref:RES family NAD+ phosphorylase n=1 Tax=Cronobacter malonaticus TaxID=413503 RepID=UPI000CFE2000|nr:RES family NAD+ phosphorylase [Cronobacter malonaticus]ELY5854341.1 RES family NAD+ phosphorylase [Cronobacter malonaticus]WRU15560.1 RES family NAD+ phosphorylase [Cronobacter malonaticus]
MVDFRDERLPAPPADMQVPRVTVWPAGKRIVRVHSRQFAGDAFNPGYGNARFSPLQRADDRLIPTLYGGIDAEVAIMESLFHDVPTGASGASFDLRKARELCISTLTPDVALELANLTPVLLRRWGVTQAALTGSSPQSYLQTRLWAAAIHAANPRLHGISWASRQHGGKALMLFGDRINRLTLHESVPLMQGALTEIYRLADEMGLILIDD